MPEEEKDGKSLLLVTRSATSSNKFPKKERISHKRAFDHLFKGGSSFYKGHLWVIYTTDLPEFLQTAPLMVGFSVPKRSFNRANKRNHLKRRLKEAFRLNKQMLLPLLEEQNLQLAFLVKYNTRKILTYHEIEHDLQRVFRKLARALEND